MDENDDADLFDDFFDNPGKPANDSTEKEEKHDMDKAGKSSPRRSKQKPDRNRSRSDRSNMSDSDSNTNYSSDSVRDSDSDSRKQKRRKSASRSRSASSRSAGSYSSDDSYSSKDSRSRSSRKKGRGSSSRSQSSSSSRSRSRTTTTDSPSRASKEKRKSKRRDSYSSVTSSDDSSYTESKNSGKRSLTPTPRSKKGAHRQAWVTEGKSNNTRQDRPRSAKKRSSHDKNSRGGAARRRTYSGVNSDSDMTEVSPILSPRNGSVNGHHKGSEDKYNRSKPAMFQAMPLDRSDSGINVHDGGDSKALDLNILMKAVSELEKQKRVKSNTRRVMFEPLRSRPKDKSNYTFSNDDTHRIDQENKRLLKQIMRQVHSKEEQLPKPSELRVQQATLTPSAVNRRRQQQRIENENLAFLRRLQKIKPTRGISRNEQLTAYNSTVLHGIPIANLHPTGKSGRKGCSSSASSVAGSLGRTRSMTSIHSTATASSVATNSRQSSRAGSRPTSAKMSGRVERPPWTDRW